MVQDDRCVGFRMTSAGPDDNLFSFPYHSYAKAKKTPPSGEGGDFFRLVTGNLPYFGTTPTGIGTSSR